MKKILSLTLAVMLLVSAIPTAYAADQDYSLGTAVTVEGAGGEYTVTVPATLNAGEVGTVTAKGYWPKEETLIVTASETIEVTHAQTNQKATVNVDFDGIEALGDDLEEQTVTASISVDKGNTKFGTWTGTIVYTVELADLPDGTFAIMHVNGEQLILGADEGMTWEAWKATDYNTIQATTWLNGVHFMSSYTGTSPAYLYTNAEGTEDGYVYVTDEIQIGTTYYMLSNGWTPNS